MISPTLSNPALKLLYALLALGVACLIAVCAPREAQAQSASEQLTWAPPVLSNPQTLTMPNTGNCDYDVCESLGNGGTNLRLNPDQDYIIKLHPDGSTLRTGTVKISGGRNVHIIGGHITANPEHRLTNGDQTTRALMVSGNKGIVHIEGVRISSAAGGQLDGIGAFGNLEGILQVQNVRMHDMIGDGDKGVHSDGIQLHSTSSIPTAAVKELRVDKVTIDTNNTGFQLMGYGPFYLKRSNVVQQPQPGHAVERWGKVLRMVFPSQNVTDNCLHSPSQGLLQVYGQTSGQDRLGSRTAPDLKSPRGCSAEQVTGGVTWPAFNIQGENLLREGLPPNGDWQPEGPCGLGKAGPCYTSPGYL